MFLKFARHIEEREHPIGERFSTCLFAVENFFDLLNEINARARPARFALPLARQLAKYFLRFRQIIFRSLFVMRLLIRQCD